MCASCAVGIPTTELRLADVDAVFVSERDCDGLDRACDGFESVLSDRCGRESRYGTCTRERCLVALYYTERTQGRSLMLMMLLIVCMCSSASGGVPVPERVSG